MQFQYSEMQQYYLLVNSKIAYVPPGRLTFLKKFSSNSLVCWQFRWSNASPASTSKRVISPAHQRLFKTIPMRQTVYSNVDILRTKHNQNMVQQNVNAVLMLNVERIERSFCLWSWPPQSNALLGGPHFGSSSPLYGAKLQSNAWGLPSGGRAVLELTSKLF